MKILIKLLAFCVIITPSYASAMTIWGSTDRGPVVGTYRIPVDTSSSSGPGYITPAEIQTFLGGPVSVTAADPSIVITPSPGTGTFTVGTTSLFNAQGTAASYAIVTGDMGKIVTHAKSTAVADTIAAAGTTGFEAGKSVTVINLGAGAVTITPTTSTINGAATLVLQQNQGATLTSDGSNYVAFSGASASGASLTSFNTFTAGNAVTPSVVSISTSTFTPNFALSNNFGVTLVHASCPCTLANPSNPVAGESGIIAVTQSATGSDLVSSYGSSYIFTNSAAPTLSTTANAVDYLSYYVLDSTHIRLAPLIATTPAYTSTNAVLSNGTKFTTSGCSISSTTGGASAGTFTLGANSCTAIITMNGATGLTATNGWSCQAHDRTAPTVLIGGESSSTTTTASITIPAGAGATDVIAFNCTGY